MSYAPNGVDVAQQARNRSRKSSGAPGLLDLPVQQPTKFELVINLKAAKALGSEGNMNGPAAAVAPPLVPVTAT